MFQFQPVFERPETVAMENLKVRQVIESKGSGKLFTIKEDCTLREMVRIACEMKIGALLVSDDDDNPWHHQRARHPAPG